MIKVEHVKSVGGTSRSLEEIKVDFLAKVKSKGTDKSTPLERIKKKKRKFPNGEQYAILDYCENNFDLIINSRPQDLESIINHFATNNWNTALEVVVKGKTTFKDVILACFGYNTFRSDPDKGIWFAGQLNIKSCPYCNAQFTVTTHNAGVATSKKFQFDHFFPTSRYPYLSISMYNLIPSCAACNLVKNDEDTNLKDYYHPYHSSISDKSIFRISNESILKKLLENKKEIEDSIDIFFEPAPNADAAFVGKHDSLYGISNIYRSHTDLAEELLMKSIMYPTSRKNELQALDIFRDDATFYRYLLGNYPLEGDILKRPLSKFTRDIAKQLGVIDKRY